MKNLFIKTTVALLTITSTLTWADAPKQNYQAPGFYRMALGDFEVTALNDGTLDLAPLQLLTNASQELIKEELEHSFQKEVFPASVNAYLINTGTKLVLIDTGTGSTGIFGPALGNVITNLKTSGYKPEQINEIYFTHLHPDHVGGLLTKTGATFPNAIVRLDQREIGYWTNDKQEKEAFEGHRPFFAFAKTSLAPYMESGRVKPFEGETTLLPGIKSVPATGHTHGHTAYSITSQGTELLIWGDVMHVGAVQFPHPEVTIVFDTNSPKAAKARDVVFANVAKKRTLVAAAHQPFPGLGYLRTAGKGYEFIAYPYGGQ